MIRAAQAIRIGRGFRGLNKKEPWKIGGKTVVNDVEAVSYGVALDRM